MDNYPIHFKRLFKIVALLMLLYIFIELYLSKTLWGFNSLIFFVPLVGFYFLYRHGFFYKPIRFDYKFFYPPNNQPVILLSSIQSIKLTSLANKNNVHYWTITYYTNEPNSIRILPPTLEDSFARFIDAVKEANPTVDTDVFEFKLYFGCFPSVVWRPNKN